MENSVNPDLIAMVSDKGEVSFINLGQVCRIDEVWKDHCRLWFSETHNMVINGKGATSLLNQLVKRSLALDGTRIKDCIEQTKSQ